MPPRFGPCDVCRGERTVTLALHGGLAVSDFDPGASINDDYKLVTPNGETRRYPCPECTKPPMPPDPRLGYSIIRVNKLVNEKLANNVPYMESTRGNVCALIGRTLMSNGLVALTQYKAPPSSGSFDNFIVEGVVGVVHPEGAEADRMIQDLDPNTYFGERMYQDGRPASSGRRPTDVRKLMSVEAPWNAPRTVAVKPNRLPRNNRELIFDDEGPPDEEG